MESSSRRIAGLLRARWLGDPETQELTPELRRRAGRSGVPLSRGVTHLELRGPSDGPVVVLVHGFSVPLYLWDPLVDPLVNAGFRVLRYDLFGRGLSDRPRGRYDEDLFDEQLVEVLDALGMEAPVHLVGLSMAASIAATFAARRPARVRSMAFLGPGFGAGRAAPRRLRAPVLGEVLMAARIAPGLAVSQLEDLHHPERFPEWPARYEEQMRYRGFRRALLATLRDYMGRDVERDYRRAGDSGKPVFLAWGAHDKRVSVAEQARIRAWIPQAEAHVIDDAAHLPHVERPDLVAPRLIAFLRRASDVR